MSLKVTPREFSIFINEKEYFLTPSLSAILDIEQRTGKGIGAILSGLMGFSFSLSDIITIVWAGIRANYRMNKKDLKDCPKWEDLGEEISSYGITKTIQSIREYMAFLINGSESLEQGQSDGDSEKN